MNEYLLIYEGGDRDWARKMSPEAIQASMAEWGAWFKQLEGSGHLRNPGAPLGPGGALLSKNGSGFQTDTTLPEVKELIGGFSVIAAETLEQATEIAKGSPFLKNTQDGVVVIRPVQAM